MNSELKITGTITHVLPEETGEGKNGEWKKQPFVIETEDLKYPKSICMDVFGVERVEKFQQNRKVGDLVDCKINIESREYNNKWYSNIGCWWIAKSEGITTPKPTESTEEGDDLPF